MCEQFYWNSDPWKAAAVVVVLAITAAVPARSGDAAISQGGSADGERAERLDAMGALARSVAVTEVTKDGTGHSPVAMRPGPLHRRSEPTRRSHDGTLWAWGLEGRPVVLLGLEQYPL
jgi:hypothetical protein